MSHPDTGTEMAIMWIIYSYELVTEWTAFYAANYGIEGVVFTDDGAGDPYIIKPDGTITCYNTIDDEETRVADTLLHYFQR